jgi:hypothetical protein
MANAPLPGRDGGDFMDDLGVASSETSENQNYVAALIWL